MWLSGEFQKSESYGKLLGELVFCFDLEVCLMCSSWLFSVFLVSSWFLNKQEEEAKKKKKEDKRKCTMKHRPAFNPHVTSAHSPADTPEEFKIFQIKQTHTHTHTLPAALPRLHDIIQSGCVHIYRAWNRPSAAEVSVWINLTGSRFFLFYLCFDHNWSVWMLWSAFSVSEVWGPR